MDIWKELEAEGVNRHLLAEVRSFRDAHGVAEEVRGRIPNPRFVYYGKDVWEAAAAAVLCGIFFLWFLPSYGQGVQQADPEFTWAYWPCLIWAWLFALPIFGAMLPCWRIFGSISAPEGAFTRRNARDMRSISRLAFADALIFPAGMFVLAFMGAGSAPLTIVITPMVIFCCAAVGIVCYVLSRLIGDAAALREENDMTI